MADPAHACGTRMHMHMHVHMHMHMRHLACARFEPWGQGESARTARHPLHDPVTPSPRHRSDLALPRTASLNESTLSLLSSVQAADASCAHTRLSHAVGSAPLYHRWAIAGLPPLKIGQSAMLPLVCPSFGASSVDSFSPPRFPARPAARQPRPRLPCYLASAARPPLALPRAPFCRRATLPAYYERLVRVQVAPHAAVCRLREVPTGLPRDAFADVSRHCGSPHAHQVAAMQAAWLLSSADKRRSYPSCEYTRDHGADSHKCAEVACVCTSLWCARSTQGCASQAVARGRERCKGGLWGCAIRCAAHA